MFLDTSDLRDGELFLKLTSTREAQPERRWLPAYYFDICLDDGSNIGRGPNVGRGPNIGRCDLRVGHNDKTYIGGNIGYLIHKPWRGHHYAARACRLLFILARRHGLDRLYITCQPDNAASARTCELAGGRLVEIAPIPEDNEMYERGERFVKVYEFIL